VKICHVIEIKLNQRVLTFKTSSSAVADEPTRRTASR